MRFRLVIRQAMILGILALFPALISAFFHPRRPSWNPDSLGPNEVRLSTVLTWKENVRWVDARSRKEFDKNHLKKAKLVNEDEWNELVPAFLETWQPGVPVVVYCDDQICYSSQEVAKRLRELGVEPVYVMRGGWQEMEARQKDEGRRMKRDTATGNPAKRGTSAERGTRNGKQE